MNTDCVIAATHDLSTAARERLLSRWGEPLFLAAWKNVLMIHFEVAAEALQCEVPFALDLFEGHAYLSLVAFTMQAMRPRRGGRLAGLLFRPIASPDFLNVRTYVRQGGERGIHFLAEWLSNRLAVGLGPAIFGLPYRYGRIIYHHNWHDGTIRGEVADAAAGARLSYHGLVSKPGTFQPCVRNSLTEWLMERYTAFNSAGRHKRFFRIWHPPWPQCPVDVALDKTSLLIKSWPWFKQARLIGANYSPGFDTVWMGRPHGSRSVCDIGKS